MNSQNIHYVAYKKWSVLFDRNKHCFSVNLEGYGAVAEQVRVKRILGPDGNAIPLPKGVVPCVETQYREDEARMTAAYGLLQPRGQAFSLQFEVNDQGVCCRYHCMHTLVVELEGLLRWGSGDQKETMAVNLHGAGRHLRTAHGPAASAVDNALFDRETDSALELMTTGKVRLGFDWEKEQYRFTASTCGRDHARFVMFKQHTGVYQKRMGIDYRPYRHESLYQTPPVGWMTWYAVGFGANAHSVMENARWQKKYLAAYGANTIWVDWEWYHSDMSGFGKPDVDMFHPEPDRYPDGLDSVARQIQDLGFIPGLWIGPTCDPTENELIKAHPDMVMLHKPYWCGQYFLDPTHPAFLQEALPRVCEQSKAWGYRAIKWDCMPDTVEILDACHENLHNPSLSARQAMRNAFQTAREALGKQCYMLYCCSRTQRDIDLACGMFDAVRIGGDIFQWDEFIRDCVDKVFKYYALHDVVIVADADNVVLREEFNTIEQARTRAVFVSLLGMPFTMGDNLPALDEERVDIIRRCIPPVRCHPRDIRGGVCDHETILLDLAVEKPFAGWHVLAVTNLKDEPVTLSVDLGRDLHLPLENSKYLLYEFWNAEYIGESDSNFMVELKAFETKVYSVHQKLQTPQIISTSRHITQGAYDLESVRWSAEDAVLSGTSAVVGGEPYTLIVHVPEDWRLPNAEAITETVCRYTLYPSADGAMDWSIPFQKK